MMVSLRNINCIVCLSFLFIEIVSVNAATFNFNGKLDYIEYDNGGGVYSGVLIGTEFTVNIDDTNVNGYISDGTTATSFGCCIAAGGLSITNDAVLTAEEAAYLNAIIGYSKYAAGNIFDVINIEGDTTTSNGGRIEIGLSYVFNSSTFSNEDHSNYPFNPDNVEVALFFIYEENSSGQNVYSGGGKIEESSTYRMSFIPFLLLFD